MLILPVLIQSGRVAFSVAQEMVVASASPRSMASSVALESAYPRTSLNLVPVVAFMTCGINVSGEAAAIADTRVSRLRASFMVLTGEVPHVTVTLMLGDTRPTQFSFSVLKRTPAVCSASIKARDGLAIASERPSLGATL